MPLMLNQLLTPYTALCNWKLFLTMPKCPLRDDLNITFAHMATEDRVCRQHSETKCIPHLKPLSITLSIFSSLSPHTVKLYFVQVITKFAKDLRTTSHCIIPSQQSSEND